MARPLNKGFHIPVRITKCPPDFPLIKRAVFSAADDAGRAGAVCLRDKAKNALSSGLRKESRAYPLRGYLVGSAYVYRNKEASNPKLGRAFWHVGLRKGPSTLPYASHAGVYTRGWRMHRQRVYFGARSTVSRTGWVTLKTPARKKRRVRARPYFLRGIKAAQNTALRLAEKAFHLGVGTR